MDWIALHHDPNWKALLESEDFRGQIAALQNFLINAKLDAEDRGYARGQLKALTTLKGWVEARAMKQQRDYERLESSENVSTTFMDRVRAQGRRIF